jgi:hypothetical protein
MEAQAEILSFCIKVMGFQKTYSKILETYIFGGGNPRVLYHRFPATYKTEIELKG